MSTIPFREFDEDGDVKMYEYGILPHWRQDHCTYFVTFRQDDALPVAVANQIKDERRISLRRRGIEMGSRDWKLQLKRLPNSEIRTSERLIGKLVNEKLDRGLGSCVLRQTNLSAIMVAALKHFHGERVLTGD